MVEGLHSARARRKLIEVDAFRQERFTLPAIISTKLNQGAC